MSIGNGKHAQVRLTFADDGEFHSLVVEVPAERLVEYDRLVDFLREEPGVTQQLYIDMRRLVSAAVIPDAEA